MRKPDQKLLQTFATLHWYDETIKFIFNFVAKTSELLLAAGIVVSSANFLTDGAIMPDPSPLSVAWAWAQALAIDSSLGIVFVNGFQSARDHDKLKAILYSRSWQPSQGCSPPSTHSVMQRACRSPAPPCQAFYQSGSSLPCVQWRSSASCWSPA